MHNIPTLPTIDVCDPLYVEKWEYPCKRIYSSIDIRSFKNSKAIANINGIISLICTSVSLTEVPINSLDDKFVNFEYNNTDRTSKVNGSTKPLPPKFSSATDEIKIQPAVSTVLAILDEIIKLKNETPPFPGPRRYGNFACRDWHDKLTNNIDDILKQSFSKYFKTDSHLNLNGFIDEIKYYLLGSFGSRERLDYGTGHELSFISFLGCLVMSDIIYRNSITGTEWLLILSKYYDLVKSLILSYTLEPAGSHGVWGLDDHFHLIYVFGSCQLIDFSDLSSEDETHEKNGKMSAERAKVLNFRMGLTPSSILNNEVLKTQRTKNLYYNAISFIKKVKSGPFNEHSPMLYQVSASKNWEKIARGMLKMYYGEVLSKFPVVQHFYFGGVFYPWRDTNNNELPSSGGDSNNDEESNLYDTVTSRCNSEMPNMMPKHNNAGENRLANILQSRSGRGDNVLSSIPTTSAPWANRNTGSIRNIPRR